MRLKTDTNNFAASFNITPPYQMLVLHSKMLIYPRELYQRGVQRKRVEMIATDFNEYVANDCKTVCPHSAERGAVLSAPVRQECIAGQAVHEAAHTAEPGCDQSGNRKDWHQGF